MSYNLYDKETGELIPIAGKGDFPCDYGTKEEFNAKKDSLPDGTVFTTTDEFVDAHAENYSTDEIVIGKWIDGRPIYRRVFELGAITWNSSVVKNINLGTNIKNIIDIKVLTTGNGYTNVECNPTQFISIGRYARSSGMFNLNGTTNAYNTNETTVIFEYIKTN